MLATTRELMVRLQKKKACLLSKDAVASGKSFHALPQYVPSID